LCPDFWVLAWLCGVGSGRCAALKEVLCVVLLAASAVAVAGYGAVNILIGFEEY